MPFLGECDRGNVGDVIGIDVAFADVSVGYGESAAHQGIAKEGLGEVLVEPSAANDRRGDAGVEDETLAELRFFLAAAGKFFEGMVVFVTGIALPLIARESSLDVLGYSLASAAILAGIQVGASTLGGLADRLGRKTVFIGELSIFILFLVALSLSPSAVAVYSIVPVT